MVCAIITRATKICLYIKTPFFNLMSFAITIKEISASITIFAGTAGVFILKSSTEGVLYLIVCFIVYSIMFMLQKDYEEHMHKLKVGLLGGSHVILLRSEPFSPLPSSSAAEQYSKALSSLIRLS
jgi:hypothetical protein